MNVFHRFTRQSLRKNRSRTWVTIVGIVLSVAMFTAVTEGAYSGVRYLVRTTEYTVGRFHGCYENVTEQQATQLSRACRRRPGSSFCRSICGPRAASAMRWGTPWSWSWATGRWVGRS